MKKSLLLLTLVLSFNLFSQENSEIVDYSIQYEHLKQKGFSDEEIYFIMSYGKKMENQYLKNTMVFR